MSYYQFTINHFSGGTTNWVFLTKEAAYRCLEEYKDKAETQEKKTNGIVMYSKDGVEFQWDSPVGFIHWSAKVRELASEDGRFQ